MFFKKNKPAQAVDPVIPQPEQSTTLPPSENISVSDMGQEKETQLPTNTADARSVSSSESRPKLETTGLEETKALDPMEEEIEYPKGAKLATITFALCISVFLMALVRHLSVEPFLLRVLIAR